MEWFGYISAACFALSGLPQAVKSFREKKTEGISVMFIALWTIGEIFGLIYVIDLGEYPLILNYSVNLVFCLIILWYMRPKYR